MDYVFNARIIDPFLYSCDSIVVEVNKAFIDLTGFKMDELLGKSLIEIGDMLRFSSQTLIDNINCNYSGFIFTKLFEAREVDISLIHSKETNQKKYFFVEKANSRLSDKLIFVEQTFIENISGVAVYSVPDLILLKDNKSYIDFQDSHCSKMQNNIGRPIREIITGYVESGSEIIWNAILETQKASYIKKFEFNNSVKGITYWDFNKLPIFENGKMKYIFETSINVTQRVLENKSLELQKKQFEQDNVHLINIIENLSEGVMLSDNKGRLIMVNQEAKRLIYQSEKAITINDTLKETKLFDMKGNEIPFGNFPVVRALRGELVKDVKVFVSHPNNNYFAQISSIPIYNVLGELTRVASCFHDITETIEQSKKIIQHKKQLEAIIENMADGISIFDNKGQYILFNKVARQRFFPTYKDLDNISDVEKQYGLYDIIGEKIDSENIPARRVMRGETLKDVRIIIKFPNKTVQRDVSGTPIYDSEGNFALGIICSRDMTDYFNQAEIIKSRYEFLSRMIDTFDLPFVRLSFPDLKIVNINREAFVIIKRLNPDIESIEQIKDNKIEVFFKIFQTSEYCQCINEVKKEKKTKYLNKQKYLINENEQYWNIIFEPMLKLNGEIQEILIVIIDVTTEIKSTIDMKKTVQSQGEFLVNISHDLKTPLNVISATAQLVNMYCKRGELDKNKNSFIKYIDSINQNCHKLSKMINNIVDLSKIESGFFKLNVSNNNIVEVVEDIVMSVTNFTDSKGLNIIFDTDIEEKTIACDPEKIERVVLNLISNAIKSTEVGDEIFIQVKDKNEFVEISVKDNGIGIEAEHLNIIFDRFKQVGNSLSRNAEGTGIGLNLVKSIVELHGGSIYVESEIGKGSKFTVILPSGKALHENMIYKSKVKSPDESIKVELSDAF
ncbi:ATP-binding protein [Clostridium sp.]